MFNEVQPSPACLCSHSTETSAWPQEKSCIRSPKEKEAAEKGERAAKKIAEKKERLEKREAEQAKADAKAAAEEAARVRRLAEAAAAEERDRRARARLELKVQGGASGAPAGCCVPANSFPSAALISVPAGIICAPSMSKHRFGAYLSHVVLELPRESVFFCVSSNDICQVSRYPRTLPG